MELLAVLCSWISLKSRCLLLVGWCVTQFTLSHSWVLCGHGMVNWSTAVSVGEFVGEFSLRSGSSEVRKYPGVCDVNERGGGGDLTRTNSRDDASGWLVS